MGVTIPYVDVPDSTKRLKREKQTETDPPSFTSVCRYNVTCCHGFPP